MNSSTPAAEAAGSSYDITTVARLTGLSAPNLRIWEKRYGLVSPLRSKSQRRLYSSEDIHRLTLLKSLVDHGHPISSIAALQTPELEHRLGISTARQSPDTGAAPARSRRMIVIGEELGALLDRDDRLEGFRVVARQGSLDQARQATHPPQADLVLVACPTLFAGTVREIRNYARSRSALGAIAVYRFAQEGTTRLVGDNLDTIITLRAPVDLNQLQFACKAAIDRVGTDSRSTKRLEQPGRKPPADRPPRRFSDADLARVSQLSSAVDCECPRHLATLLGSLTAFEQYSLECEHRNPQDAATHIALNRATAHARKTMEDALRDLMIAEGIECP